jgi:hypothetical protein
MLGFMMFQHYVSLLSPLIAFKNASESQDVDFLKKQSPNIGEIMNYLSTPTVRS